MAGVLLNADLLGGRSVSDAFLHEAVLGRAGQLLLLGSGGALGVPGAAAASAWHFFMKLFLAAPASFFSAARAAQSSAA